MPPSYSKKYRKLSIAGSRRDVFTPWKRIPIGCPVKNDGNTENIHTSTIFRPWHISSSTYKYICKVFMIYYTQIYLRIHVYKYS